MGIFLCGTIKGAKGMPCMECTELIFEGVWYDADDGGPINVVCRNCATSIFAEVGLAIPED